MAMLRLRNRDDSKFARAVLQHRGFSAGAVNLYEIRCIARHDFMVFIAHVKHCEKRAFCRHSRRSSAAQPSSKPIGSR